MYYILLRLLYTTLSMLAGTGYGLLHRLWALVAIILYISPSLLAMLSIIAWQYRLIRPGELTPLYYEVVGLI